MPLGEQDGWQNDEITGGFCFHSINFLFCVGVNNVVIVSGKRLRDSAYICMHPFSPKHPSLPGCPVVFEVLVDACVNVS